MDCVILQTPHGHPIPWGRGATLIDLESGREQMLAEIGASAHVAERLTDAMDPRFLSGEEAWLLARGHSPDELFSLLEVVLSARLARVPRFERTRDLLSPLRKALGNAYKHGHRRDRSKTIEVEVVVTRRGAVLSVRDEGKGFDAALQVGRLRGGTRTFAGEGAGLLAFERARSSVAFEDGGRTVSIRFLPAGGDPPGDCRAFARDSERLCVALRDELGSSLGMGRGLAACRAYEGAPGAAQLRFVLRSAGEEGSQTRILTGRLHESEDAASADLALARALHARAETKELHIAPPVAQLRAEPRLVLSDFDPWLDLEDYLAERGKARVALRVAERVGCGLRAVHRSGVPAPEEPWPEALAREGARTDHASEALSGVDPEQGRRARRLAGELVQRLAALAPGDRSPVHRCFGFGSVSYGVDSRFYLAGFERMCLSHPGFDLGGFLADLLRVGEKTGDPELGRAARESLLVAYGAGQVPTRDWEAELPLFVASALLERLGGEPRPDGASLLELCERALHAP